MRRTNTSWVLGHMTPLPILDEDCTRTAFQGVPQNELQKHVCIVPLDDGSTCGRVFVEKKRQGKKNLIAHFQHVHPLIGPDLPPSIPTLFLKSAIEVQNKDVPPQTPSNTLSVLAEAASVAKEQQSAQSGTDQWREEIAVVKFACSRGVAWDAVGSPEFSELLSCFGVAEKPRRNPELTFSSCVSRAYNLLKSEMTNLLFSLALDLCAPDITAATVFYLDANMDTHSVIIGFGNDAIKTAGANFCLADLLCWTAPICWPPESLLVTSEPSLPCGDLIRKIVPHQLTSIYCIMDDVVDKALAGFYGMEGEMNGVLAPVVEFITDLLSRPRKRSVVNVDNLSSREGTLWIALHVFLTQIKENKDVLLCMEGAPPFQTALEVLDFLEPFMECICVFKVNQISVHRYLPTLSKLKESLEGLEKDAWASALRHLNSHIDKVQQDKQMSRFLEFADFLSGCCSKLNKSEKYSAVSDELAQYELAATAGETPDKYKSPGASTNLEIEAFLELSPDFELPEQFWRTNGKKFPKLRKIARAVLAVQARGIRPERNFLHGALLRTYLNTLYPDREARMLVASSLSGTY